MRDVGLVLALHVHQPVGNLDHVIHQAMDDSYLPFLDVMERFPDIPFSLHISGCLFDWAEEHRPEYVDRVAAFVARGQVEIVGGGRAEPIFAMLPRRDAVSQLRSFADLLEARLGARPRGAWLPERVWEQHFASVFNEAGAEFTIVDDHHLRRAGVAPESLFNVFLTEDEGDLLRLFPSCERLRYLIPFHDPAASVDYLRGAADETGRSLLVYADDGEKFGVWPGTRKHVYTDGWLERFLEALRENRSWLHLLTFAQAMARADRPERIYVPDASYREMTEWALPSRRLARFREIEKDLTRQGKLESLQAFLGGGFWRNFKVKYLEAAKLYARMMETSRAVNALPEDHADREAAELALHRGQCNCVYWHGVFGGLYMPHLRFAAYKELLAAHALAVARRGAPAAVSADFDFDGQNEICLAQNQLRAYVSPARGGHLYELDLMDVGFNALAGMTRRFEDYHGDVSDGGGKPGDVVTIHDKRPTKGKGVKDRIVYDNWEREGAVDHFFRLDVSPRAMRDGTAADLGDFHSGPYAPDLTGQSVTLRRDGMLRSGQKWLPVHVEKSFSLLPQGRGLRLVWELSSDHRLENILFASEFNFSMLAGDTDDRYYAVPGEGKLGQLGMMKRLEGLNAVTLVEEWQQVRLSLAVAPRAAFFLFPIETVSQSEGGFELLYQQSCVTPAWRLALRPGETFHAELEFKVHTGPEAVRPR